nr:integrase, catalytic region, zinc finger, CCHC-type, peptidase aspartic, catalytic [Tanacetum cinerariifolium]
MELECAKVRGDLLSNKIEYERYHNKYTQTINDLNQTVLELKEKLSAHQDTISILKQQKDAQIKLYKIREDKDNEKVIDLENKVKVLDNIVYKTGQSVQTMNMLNNKCRTSFAKPECLKKAKQANPRLYDIGCYNDNLALMLSLESDEVIRLEKESRSKLSDLVRPFDYAKLNSLYDLFVPQREKSFEQRFFSELSRIKLSKSKMMSKSFESVQKHAINLELELQQCKEKVKNDMSFKVNKSKDFCKEREQYFEIQDLKAQLQDKGIVIRELKKLIEKLKGKYVDTKFEKSSVTKNKVSNDFSKPVTAQTLPTKKKSCLKNMNVLAPGMYKLHTDHTQARTSKLPQDSKKTNKRVSFSTGVIPTTRVIPTTSVSRPQLKSNPMGDRVLRSNSHEKKLEVEEHRRNVKLPKNKTSITACNDSLNAKTLNVKSVFAMCDKCVMIDKHDLCVIKSVAKPLKKTVASESNKKTRNNVRKLNEGFGKIYKWSYIKFTPSGYMWKPKSPSGNVNPNLIEIILFIVDSGYSKHMTGNLKLLINFVEKFLGTVKFGNDQIAPIFGYGDLVQGVVTIKRVYYVEGLNHNLFSVGQFCDADLEVAFRKSTCFIRD